MEKAKEAMIGLATELVTECITEDMLYQRRDELLKKFQAQQSLSRNGIALDVGVVAIGGTVVGWCFCWCW